MKFNLRDGSGERPHLPGVVIDLDRCERVPLVFRLDTEAGECECWAADAAGNVRTGPTGLPLTEARRGRFAYYPLPPGVSRERFLREHPELLAPAPPVVEGGGCSCY